MQRHRFSLALLILALLGVGPALRTSAQQNVPADAITLGPGDAARVPVHFWSLDYDKPFPATVAGPAGRTREEIVSLLEAAGNTVSSNPYQVQLAIWYIADGTYHDGAGRGHSLAQELLAAAPGATPAPPAPGTLLLGAGTNDVLKITVEDLVPLDDTGPGSIPPYSGAGTLVIQNTGSESVRVDVTGAVFRPASEGRAQSLVAQQAANPAGSAPAAASPESMAAAQSDLPAPAVSVVQGAVAGPTAEPPGTAEPAQSAQPAQAAAAVAAAPVLRTTAEPRATHRLLSITGTQNSTLAAVLLGAGALALLAGLGLHVARRRA